MSNDQYRPQAGTWTLTAPDGRYWQGMTPLAVCRAEINERIPPSVQMANLNAAMAADAADEDAEISRLQAANRDLAEALRSFLAACPDAHDGRLGLPIRVTQDCIDACRQASKILYPDALARHTTTQPEQPHVDR